MKKLVKINLSNILCIVCIIVLNLIITSNVLAEEINVSAPDSWKERAALTGLYKCYDSQYMRSQIDEIGSFGSFKQAFYGYSDIKPNEKPNWYITMYNWKGEKSYDCKEFFMGGNKESKNENFKGVFSIFNKSGTASTWQEKTNLVTNMGYTESQATEQSATECTYYVYAFSNPAVVPDGRYYLTQNICLSGNGKIMVEPAISGCPEVVTGKECSGDDEDSQRDFIKFSASNDGKTLYFKSSPFGVNESFTYDGDWNKFKKKIDDFFLNDFCYDKVNNMCKMDYDRTSAGGQLSPPDINVFVYNRSISNTTSTQNINSYEISNFTSAANKATRYLSDGTYDEKNDKLKITKAEKLAYYLKALREIFDKDAKNTNSYYECYTIGRDITINVGIDDEQDYISKYSDLGTPINIDFSGKTNPKTTTKVDGEPISYCVVLKSAIDSHKDYTVPNWVDENGFFNVTLYGPRLNITTLIEEINNLSKEVSEEDLLAAVDSDWSYTAPNSQPNGDNVTCMNSAGTSLGWILCPVLDAFGGATKWVYNDLVEPALQIEPQLFTGKGDGTQDAWRTFRDIANIFFIILFLVVIFSQLTGVGIDNYGIKKILPKLIIVAVLINLSYIICLVFVDLSNIFGNGLRSIFTDLGSRLTVPSSIEGVEVSTGSGILTFIAVLIALIVGVGVAISASGGLVAFLVSLLAVALSAIVALFFLFLLLAAREAAIVVLTVLSPLAFACYILPNTQNIFKKWYQLGWRLLLVYPIAGLLIGGGDYVSKLLLSSGVAKEGFFSAFVAMIAGIVPIFFIPTVLKQSFALMGGLGAKLSGLGRSIGGRMSGNLDKSIRGSEQFKNYQADRERNRKLGFARRTNERLTNRQNNGRPLNDRQRRLLASARMAESAEYAEDLKRNAIVDGSRYEAMRAGIRAKDQDQAINDRLALMQSSGIMVGGQRSAYTLDNLSARMRELETASRSRALSSDEQSEMAALARGMVSQKGGAGMLNNIVRDAGRQENGSQTLNSNFMSSLGQIYNDDSAVAGKMVEKDGGMGGYMEKFMPGGAGGDSFDSYLADTGDGGYAANAAKRIKSHEAGLNQSGEAFKHYLGTLDKNQTQAIMDNPTLLNSLDTDNRAQFMEYAKNTHGITQATPRQVEIAGENQVFDVHSLDDDTLLDIATNPNISDNDPNRRAAVEELGKRNIK